MIYVMRIITLLAISAAKSLRTLTNIIEPVIQTRATIFTLSRQTLAKPGTAVSNTSGICRGTQFQFLVVDEHVSHAAKKVISLNVFSSMTDCLLKIFNSTQIQRRTKQVKFSEKKKKKKKSNVESQTSSFETKLGSLSKDDSNEHARNTDQPLSKCKSIQLYLLNSSLSL